MIIPYDPQYDDKLLSIMHRAVMSCDEYTERERAAWTPLRSREASAALIRKLRGSETYLVEELGEIIGFGNLLPGEIDCLYIDPAFQRKGYGSLLLMHLENRLGRGRAVVHASHRALPFFLSAGWSYERENEVIREGIAIRNHLLSKIL